MPAHRDHRLRIAALLLCSAAALTVRAQHSDTLGRIAATGVINLGHRESSVPFSYYDSRRQVVGYSHELMLAAVEAVRVERDLPPLTIRLVPVTSQNRIALVQSGAVDLECGSTTHNAERGRQVAFSVSIFVVGTRLLTHRNSGIRDFDDLDGHTAVTTAGTTSERLLRTLDERGARRLSIVLAKDHDDSLRTLEAGRADAFVIDDALLYGARARAAHPDDWVISGTPMSVEAYGCMMRRGDVVFKQAVDRALTRLMQSGQALKIYVKWFQRPIPPKGLNLNWPPSRALLELYRHPTDQPLD